jgi:signal recognition particle subunit SRP54
MGDVVGLVEKAQEVVDQAAAQKTAERLFADRFTMLDLQFMFDQVQRIGGMKDLLAKLPGGASLPEGAADQLPGDEKLVSWRAVIGSMTPQERMDPSVLHMQRRHRIARGSGTSIAAVNEVIKAYKDMRRQMKDLKRQGLLGRMANRAFERQKAKELKRLKREGVDLKGWFPT